MNTRGQATIEMVLLTVVSVLIVGLVIQGANSSEYFANMVSGPWQSLAGLIQNGVLGTPQATYLAHPNQFDRFSSPRGDQPPGLNP